MGKDMRKPKENDIYRHFKGNLYRVITLAKMEATEEEMVVYQALYGEYGVFIRPLQEFCGPVDLKKYPEAAQMERFKLIPMPGEKIEKHVQFNFSDTDKEVETAIFDIKKSELKTEDTADEFKKTESKTANKPDELKKSKTETNADKFKKTEPKTETNAVALKESESDKEAEEELQIHPLLMEFLDANSFYEKARILNRMKDIITDDMINTMAVSIDVEVNSGPVYDRYESLKYCVQKRQSFELGNRLR